MWPLVRSVGGGVAGAELEVEAEVRDERLGHEADEIGIAREFRVDTVEGSDADCGAPNVGESLKDCRRESGPGQIGR